MSYQMRQVFPETKFVKEFSFGKQLEVVLGELAELEQAHELGLEHEMKLEAADVMHAAAQLMYMIGMNDSEIMKYAMIVQSKNRARDYYANIQSLRKLAEKGADDNRLSC